MDRKCVHCSEPVTRQRAVYCSVRCRNAAEYLRRKNGLVVHDESVCEECGITYIKGRTHQFCCSKSCSTKKWRRENMTPARRRAAKIKYHYGISVEEWQEMFDSQNGLCKICSKSLEISGRGYATDHCHGSGEVRGILCGECNLGIGYFKDSPALLRSAALYLEEYYS